MAPDVILVGEMRDLETISAAISAAETGHVVFGTLHTSSAEGTVNRIIDVFPTNQQEQIRTQLSTAILGVLSQCLLPKKPKGVDPNGIEQSALGLGLRVGIELVSALVVAVAIGYGLDWAFGTRPVFTALFVPLGGAAGVWNVWRLFAPKSDRGTVRGGRKS